MIDCILCICLCTYRLLCRLVLLISSSQSRKEDREQREIIIIIINKYRESVYTVQ